MAKWYLTTKKADFDAIAGRFGISPPLARLIRNRDIVEEADIQKYLYGGREDFYSPFLLKDMEKAVAVLSDKIREGKKIRIIGDYDADGICASYILYRGLTACGGLADTVIPHRMKDGYGLNSSLVQEAAADQVDTIITCDNGIAASDQIKEAKELGMTVIVTDHHEVPYEEKAGVRTYLLPKADAVIDPKQEDCTYPFSGICGGVVAYKLVEALTKRITAQPLLLDELLEIAAFSTVCDVMELRDENRLIVKCGLKLMARTRNTGLQALMEVCGLDQSSLSAYHIGFVLGPCINATGRLDTAKRALMLFQEKDRGEAVKIAAELKELNESRKQMTIDWTKTALEMIENEGYDKDKVLIIYLPKLHESLAGIIAGRIREKYTKPVFVLTDGEEGIKGSGRSIDAYHMYEEMSVCKDLFTRYGGHKMAAGLSMEKEKLDEFKERLKENCKLTEEDFEEKVSIDIALPFSYLNKKFVEELSLLEPHGMGNPRPVFARKQVHLIGATILGKNKNVGKYKVADEDHTVYEMMYFGDLEQFGQFLTKKAGEETVRQLYEGRKVNIPLDVTYYPSINRYGGRESIQIVMNHYQ